jgi:hypothetical protein
MLFRKAILLGGLGLMIAGCNYYAVTDPSSGRTYYTRMITDRLNGSIAFEDARTGDDVVLQSYEVHKISHDRYDTGVHGTVVTPAAVVIPAAAPSATVITPGQSRTVVTPDRTGTIVTPPSPPVVTPGSGAVITPAPSGSTVVTPGSGGTVVTPGSGQVDINVHP